MFRLIGCLGLVVSMTLLAGCAAVPRLTGAKVGTISASAGKMAEVGVHITTTQNDAVISASLPKQGVDVSYYLHQLAETLQQQGFVPVPYHQLLTRRLTWHLGEIRYAEEKRSLFNGARISGALHIKVVSHGRDYTHTYIDSVTMGHGFGRHDREVRLAVHRLLDHLFQQANRNAQWKQFLIKE